MTSARLGFNRAVQITVETTSNHSGNILVDGTCCTRGCSVKASASVCNFLHVTQIMHNTNELIQHSSHTPVALQQLYNIDAAGIAMHPLDAFGKLIQVNPPSVMHIKKCE